MKKFSSKATVLFVAAALLLLTAAGSTLAYLVDDSTTITNTFIPTKVACAVVENGQAYTASAVSVASKSDVTIQNTGTIPAYIRASILVSWKSADGIVYAAKPREGATHDYTLRINTDDWTKQGGYYYHNSDVSPDLFTEVLIESVQQYSDGPVGADGTQYYLSVEIVAEAIQADGMGAATAQAAWAAARD